MQLLPRITLEEDHRGMKCHIRDKNHCDNLNSTQVKTRAIASILVRLNIAYFRVFNYGIFMLLLACLLLKAQQSVTDVETNIILNLAMTTSLRNMSLPPFFLGNAYIGT